MFNMKMRARYLLKGKSFKLFVKSLIPPLLLMTALLSAVIPVMSIISGTDAVMPDFTAETAVVADIFLSVSSLVLVLFCFMIRFYNKAVLFAISDPAQCKCGVFYCFSQTFRYIRCRLIVFLCKSVWVLLFFSPAFITAGFTAFEMIHSGEMIKSIFITLSVLTVFLFIGGIAFYFTVTGRYYLTDYLMCISPMQPAKEVVSSSVICLKGKLVSLAFARLRLVPLRILSLVPFFAPYYQVFVKLLEVMTAEKFYGGTAKEKKTAPVVFYINKRSVFSPL